MNYKNENKDDILLSGEKLCPITHKKCQSLCPAPMTTSDGFTMKTGWSGNKIGKCQEGIYLMFESKDGKSTEIRYLPVEVYSNIRMPLPKTELMKSNVIGWGNYEKELKASYRNPYESHIFFKDPVSGQEQKNLIGQPLTKVTPMNLELSVIPDKDVYNIRYDKEDEEMLGVFDHFKSGYLLDLRLLRMVKEIEVLNGANSMYSSASGAAPKLVSSAYQTPVDYRRQYKAIEEMEKVYGTIKEKTKQIQELIKLSEGHDIHLTYNDVRLSEQQLRDLADKYYNDDLKQYVTKDQLLSFVTDKIIKLYIRPQVFRHFAGKPLSSENTDDAGQSESECSSCPDLYIYAWDNPFDDNDYDFTLYHLSGEEVISKVDEIPIVKTRVPEGCTPPANLPDGGPDGLESPLGMEALENYFIDAGVQVGAISAPMRSYLNLLGTTYVANLKNYKK